MAGARRLGGDGVAVTAFASGDATVSHRPDEKPVCPNPVLRNMGDPSTSPVSRGREASRDEFGTIAPADGYRSCQPDVSPRDAPSSCACPLRGTEDECTARRRSGDKSAVGPSCVSLGKKAEGSEGVLPSGFQGGSPVAQRPFQRGERRIVSSGACAEPWRRTSDDGHQKDRGRERGHVPRDGRRPRGADHPGGRCRHHRQPLCRPIRR